MNNECRKFVSEIEKLRKKVMLISLDYKYIPNSRPHQSTWIGDDFVDNAFSPHIGEEFVRQILLLQIENNLKVLLLLGIGVLIKDGNADYLELMKVLAQSQHLFIIIASSDYIYGTNYQFCHGVIGKDINNMTQQKTIQEQITQSEANLAAQQTVTMEQAKMLTDEAIRKAKWEHLELLASDTGMNLEEIESVLQPIIDSCTKESISGGKVWIFSKVN